MIAESANAHRSRSLRLSLDFQLEFYVWELAGEHIDTILAPTLHIHIMYLSVRDVKIMT